MIIVLKPDATRKQIDHVLERIEELGFKPHVSRGECAHHHRRHRRREQAAGRAAPAIPGVEQVLPIMKPFKLASREFHKPRTRSSTVKGSRSAAATWR